MRHRDSGKDLDHLPSQAIGEEGMNLPGQNARLNRGPAEEIAS